MTTAFRIATVLLLTLAATSRAQAADPALISSAATSLQSAMNGGSAPGMLKARGQFEALLAAEPGSAILHYWMAVADWRVTPMLMKDQKDKAARYAKDGIAQCDEAIRLDSHLAEALAVKGSLQGMSISFDPSSAMTLGPQGNANLQRAQALAPHNPRVWLLSGISALSRPPQFGGGPDAAGPVFERAVESLAADSAGAPGGPTWGHDDVHVWAGRCAMAKNDYAGALAHYHEALKINPDNGWVRTQLLPQAESALAAKKDKP
jgi:tetratricopeptide (TPR) repeat protein